MVTRREFIKVASALCGGAYGTYVGPRFSGAAGVTAAAGSMQFGYAAITWGNKVNDAIDDVAAVGFRGIQLRVGDGTFDRYGANPSALRDLLAHRKLSFPVLSSGNPVTDP